ncbi:hypothetical protein CC2G_000221 [Coprinopsis cinerea AmutBmut pab1-1]|nr:hypothetical protein CC2G_000221 [Coprinopsis cinerea AmutBmut pab1-1]
MTKALTPYTPLPPIVNTMDSTSHVISVDCRGSCHFDDLPPELQQIIYSMLAVPHLKLFAQDKRFVRGATINLRNRFTRFMVDAGLDVKRCLAMLRRTGSAFSDTRILSILDPATRPFGTPTVVAPRDQAKRCVKDLLQQGFRLDNVQQIDQSLSCDTPWFPAEDFYFGPEGIEHVVSYERSTHLASCRGDDHDWPRPNQIHALLVELPADSSVRQRLFGPPLLSRSSAENSEEDDFSDDDGLQGGVAHPHQPTFGGIRRIWALSNPNGVLFHLIESISSSIYVPILLSPTTLLMNCLTANCLVSFYPANTFDGTGLLTTGGFDTAQLRRASDTLTQLRDEGYEILEWCDNVHPHYNHDHNEAFCYAGRRSIHDRHVFKLGFWGGNGPRLRPHTGWCLGGRPPIHIRVPVHLFHHKSPTPLNLHIENYVDTDIIVPGKAYNTRDYMNLIGRAAPDHTGFLTNRYAVFWTGDSLPSLSRNEYLERLFQNVVVKGNVLVVEHNNAFQCVDVDVTLLPRYELLAASVVSQYTHLPSYHVNPTNIECLRDLGWPPSVPVIRSQNILLQPSPLFTPDLLNQILEFLPTFYLPVVAGLSSFHRRQAQLVLRARLRAAVSNHFSYAEFPSFLALLHTGRLLLVGDIVRRVLQNESEESRRLDLIVCSPSWRKVFEYLEDLGYRIVSFTPPKAGSSHSTGATMVLSRRAFLLSIVESLDYSPYQTLLRSSNTLQINAISNTLLTSFYPLHVHARRGWKVYDDNDFNYANPNQMLYTNTTSTPGTCNLYCPAETRNTYSDRGTFTFLWNGRYAVDDSSLELVDWNSSPALRPVTAYSLQDPEPGLGANTWEVEDPIALWTLDLECSNPNCPNSAQI